MNPHHIHCLILLAASVLVASGCNSGPDPVAPQPSAPTPEQPATPDPVGVNLSPHGEAHLLPVPPGPDEGVRGRRRMDVDQLDASIQRVTGGIAWTESGAGSDNLFEELSATLGKPDYIDSTQEDLTVSLLFEKFLGDAAQVVCSELVAREQTVSAEERVLLVHAEPESTPADDAEGVEANLRYLLLRYHGQDLSEGDPRITPWSWLFESSLHVNDGNTMSAWQAVCVALIIHPDFYSY